MGLIVNWKDLTVTWDDATIPMPEYGSVQDNYDVNLMYEDLSEPANVKEATKRSERMIDAKYKKADLRDCVKQLFDGTLGTWNAPPVDFTLKPNAVPYHACKTTSYDVNLMYEDLSEPANVKEATKRSERMIDAKYEKADLRDCVKQCVHLNIENQQKLYKVLVKYEGLFDGTLGTWNAPPVDFTLKPNAVPYHARAFPIPQSLIELFKHEVE
eukprot:scaffold69823_cov70-Attheya_sp.AAC.1